MADDSRIEIDGKTIVVSSEDSPEHLQRVADYINGKIEECKKSESYSKMAMDTRVLLLELNIGDDYINTKEKLDKVLIELAEKNKELFETKKELDTIRKDFTTARNQVLELQTKAAENANKIIKLETELKKNENKKK